MPKRAAFAALFFCYNPNMERLPAKAVEECIGMPTREWVSNCHLIAILAVKAGCFEGTPRYGMYSGDVDEDCPISSWVDMYEDGIPIRHAWIEQTDGTIVDPTRWVFEDDYPYIAVISEDDWEHDEYDPGMQAFKSMFRSPCPARDDPRPSISEPLLEFKPEGKLLSFVMHATEDAQGYPFTKGQIFWLANMTPDELGEFARPFYRELEKADLDAFVPADYWDMMMGSRRNPLPANYRPPRIAKSPSDPFFYFSEAVMNIQAGIVFVQKGLPPYAATRFMNAAYHIKNVFEYDDTYENSLFDAYTKLYRAGEEYDGKNWWLIKDMLLEAINPLYIVAMDRGMTNDLAILRRAESLLRAQ